MEAASKHFFLSPYFAVAGASQDTSKFGYKVLAWYAAHSLPVTPLNPNTPSIRLSASTTLSTVPSPSSLPHPTETSLSIITPPKVTRQLLKEAKEAGIRAVWLQPGTFGPEELEIAKKAFGEEGVVAGEGQGTSGGEGWCVLVDGEDAMRGREEEEKGRL